MSFYNADPRAYFNIYADVTWNTVWGKQEESPSENLTWKDTIDNYEIGRLIRIKNGESKSSADYNNQIFVVEYGNNDIIYNKENNTSDEQSNHKYLKPLDLTNPYSMAIGENTKANANNQTVVGKNNADNDNALFIVGNGTDKNENNRSNAFEVLKDGTLKIPVTVNASSSTDAGILSIRKFNNQNTLCLDGNAVAGGTISIESDIKVINEDDSGTKIAEIKTSDDASLNTNGVIKLPKNINNSSMINFNHIKINSNCRLKTDTIESISPTGNYATSLKLNIDGNTQIGKNDANSIASGLQFGGYPIQIIPYNQWSTLINKDSNTLYIVLPQPSQS